MDFAAGVVGFLGPFGMGELIVVLLIVIIIFGASKLPQLGRGLGEGISNFKSGLKAKDDPRALEDKNQNR
ncbi:MAG: twin-arginine translocase TatA/TatE family subunit [Thermoanaerobaculia bacterium]